MNLKEIETRLSAIATEIDTATGEQLAALETEVRGLKDQKTEIEKRQQLRNDVASGIVPATVIVPSETKREKETNIETRAKAFADSKKMAVDTAEMRSVLISSGTLATPTPVSGIYDIPGSKYSGIIDMVSVVDCGGMGSNKIAYVAVDAAAADNQIEGQAGATKEPTFAYKTITPTSVAVVSQISDQVKKQSPLAFMEKVRTQAFTALRKNAVALIVAALKASDLVETVTATLDNSNKGVIDETTLRKIAMNYGGNESVIGDAVLFLDKVDLLAFGDVRGTNEKKAVYEITPDSANPNTGIIRDGGLAVRYCITSGLTACSGTAQTSSAIETMFYGQPKNFELDLFSQYAISVSSDFAFTSRMDTILGSVDLGGDVVVKNGFIALTIASNA